MKTSQKISVALIGGASALLGLWFFHASHPVATIIPLADPTPTSVATQSPSSAEAVQSWSSSTQKSGLPSAAVTENFRQKTLHIYQHRRSVERNQRMEDQYASLAKDPEAIRLATIIVGDPSMSTQIFAEDQAYARVFAIGLLDHLANNGQISALEEAVHRIGNHLNAGGSRAQGVDADYIDLLSSYIRNRGLESIVEDPEAFLQKISYSQVLALDVEKAFYDSGVLRSMTPEQDRVLSRYFAKKTSPDTRKQETY